MLSVVMLSVFMLSIYLFMIIKNAITLGVIILNVVVQIVVMMIVVSVSRARSPPQSGGQKGASLGKALALLSNIILGWKGLLKLIANIL